MVNHEEEPSAAADVDEVFDESNQVKRVETAGQMLATLKMEGDDIDGITRRILFDQNADKKVLLTDVEEAVAVIFHRFLQTGNNNNNKTVLKLCATGIIPRGENDKKESNLTRKKRSRQI